VPAVFAVLIKMNLYLWDRIMERRCVAPATGRTTDKQPPVFA
jgi:hypothetical protein